MLLGEMDASEQLDDPPVNTAPNLQPPKMDVSPKKFLQSILAAKWQVRHSEYVPKLQRRHLPSVCKNPSSMHTAQCTPQAQPFPTPHIE